MKPYPLELRQRIVEAVDQQHGTIEEIARIFQVHSSYIYKLLRQRRERHDLAPLPHGGVRRRSWRPRTGGCWARWSRPSRMPLSTNSARGLRKRGSVNFQANSTVQEDLPLLINCLCNR